MDEMSMIEVRNPHQNSLGEDYWELEAPLEEEQLMRIKLLSFCAI